MNTATTHHIEHGPTQSTMSRSCRISSTTWISRAKRPPGDVAVPGDRGDVLRRLADGLRRLPHDAPREVALASEELNVVLGCINTVVLLASSLTMAMAVRAAGLRARRELVMWLVLTMVLGTAFLGNQGHRMDQRLSRALDPGLELSGPRERPSGRANKKDSNLERWSCSLFFTSS